MTFLQNIIQINGLKTASFPVKIFRDPLLLGMILTLLIGVTGGLYYGLKNRELLKVKEEQVLTTNLIAQKEKNISALTEEVKKINTRLQQKYRSVDHLTTNERKMSQVLEKMTLLAAGSAVEVVSFRPDSLFDEEKDTLLTVRIKIKTKFNELIPYLSRIGRFPQPVKIDSVKIETIENETPFINAELQVMTRIHKDEG